MNVVIIGTGNVATILGRLLHFNGFQISKVVGRDIIQTKKLADLLMADCEVEIQNLNDEADCYMIAVSDAAIPLIAKQLKRFTDKLVFHTAGSVSLHSISLISSHIGVLWPLQSLRKEISQIPEIPCMIDANNEEAYRQLLVLAKAISKTNIGRATDLERKKLHLAAVITSNFSNHLFALVDYYCKTEKIPFNVLYPLINETFNRIQTQNPSKVQTGPAIRRDQETIREHEQLLEKFPQILNLYKQFTLSIQSKSE